MPYVMPAGRLEEHPEVGDGVALDCVTQKLDEYRNYLSCL